jgi:hypothetical protein
MMRFTHTQGVAALAGLLLAVVQAPASMAAPEWLSDKNFTFGSFAYDQDARLVCNERWHFGADGIKTITLGKRTLRMKYKIEDGATGTYLVEEKLDSSQGDDCLSTLRDNASTPRRYMLARMTNGSFLLVKRNEPLLPDDFYGRADAPNSVVDGVQRRCEDATKGPAPYPLAQKPIEKFDACVAAEANKRPAGAREAICALGRSGGAERSTVEVYMSNGRCRTDYE